MNSREASSHDACHAIQFFITAFLAETVETGDEDRNGRQHIS